MLRAPKQAVTLKKNEPRLSLSDERGSSSTALPVGAHLTVLVENEERAVAALVDEVEDVLERAEAVGLEHLGGGVGAGAAVTGQQALKVPAGGVGSRGLVVRVAVDKAEPVEPIDDRRVHLCGTRVGLKNAHGILFGLVGISLATWGHAEEHLVADDDGHYWTTFFRVGRARL